MGAKTAMVVALRRRVPIANLIPVDNAPVDAALKGDFGKYVQAMRRIENTLGITKQSQADKILQHYEGNLPIRQFLLTNLVWDKENGRQKFRVPLKYLASALDNMADFPYKDPEEARYEGRTLFVRGTKSRYVADEVLPIIGRFFPKFQVVDIEAGHWLISEQPEEFRKGVSASSCELGTEANVRCSCRGIPTRWRLMTDMLWLHRKYSSRVVRLLMFEQHGWLLASKVVAPCSVQHQGSRSWIVSANVDRTICDSG